MFRHDWNGKPDHRGGAHSLDFVMRLSFGTKKAQ